MCDGNFLIPRIFISNGVRQGSALSPVLFAVYLNDLRESGAVCYWDCQIYGADDIVLLALCASAMRYIMLSICITCMHSWSNNNNTQFAAVAHVPSTTHPFS